MSIKNNTSPVSRHRQCSGKPTAAHRVALAGIKETSKRRDETAEKATKSTFSKKAMPKAEQTVDLTNGLKLKISGVTAADGDKFVVVRQGAHLAVTPLRDWHAGGGDASRALASQGIIVVLDMAKVRHAVASIQDFVQWPVVVTPGRLGLSYVLTSGEVIAADGTCPPLKAFTPTSDILSKQGSFKVWRSEVAEPLAHHVIPSFFVMAAFAAALLRETDRVDNIGFELSGRGGIGKSTVLELMASVAGRAIGSDGFTYWRTCNATMNALETSMADFNDMPLILDEAGVMEKAGKTEERARALRDMIFRLAGGRVKHRHGERPSRVYRLVHVTSSNRPLPTLLGVTHAAEAEAISDRLINVPLLDEREFGAFDHLPVGYQSIAEFVSSVKRAAAEHYGHALPKYLRYLTKQLAVDPKRIREFTARTIVKFMVASGTDPNNGSQKRVAEACAIIAAGGLLAKRAGVLPESYRPLEVTLEVWALHRDHGRTSRTFDDRLRALMKHPDTLDLDTINTSEVGQEMLKTNRCMIRTGKSGDRHLLVPKLYRDRWLPGWNVIRHDGDVTQRLVRARGRNAGRVLVVSGLKKVTCYRFDISELEE